MNIFKFSRGDFFGIIIPGAFLVLNLVLLFSQDATYYAKANGINLKEIVDGREGLIVIALLVASYSLGFGLRVISPGYMEKIFFLVLLPIITIVVIYQYLLGNHKKPRYLYLLLKCKYSKYSENFPYTKWFFRRYIRSSPDSYRSFYRQLLKEEFNGKFPAKKGKYFINYCKLSIYNSSEALRDEVLFCEGLVRFLSGMSLSLALSILIVFVKGEAFSFLILPYIGLLAVFGVKLRSIRVKEVLSIFESFALINNVPHNK